MTPHPFVGSTTVGKMITTFRALPVAAALALALAACGGSSDEPAEISADTTAEGIVADEPEDFTEVETEDTEAAVEEAPAETAAAPAETTGDAAAEEGVSSADVSLVEWAIEAPTEYAAGEVTFNASNDGTVPHELVVIEGAGYEALPLAEGGAVIEEELPTGALIGSLAPIGAGGSETLMVDLAPGDYVLVCNLGSGGASHAGRGQHLDITVS